MKKLIRTTPLFIVVLCILFLTIQSSESTLGLSNALREWLVNLCNRLGISPDQWWNTGRGIRSLGHIIEYFVLGIIAGLTIKRKLYAIFICSMVSLFDQITKIFVPMRYFDKGDIPFDIIGFVSGLLIGWIISFAIKEMRKNEENRR